MNKRQFLRRVLVLYVFLGGVFFFALAVLIMGSEFLWNGKGFYICPTIDALVTADAMKNVIGTAGFIGFALTYINSVRRIRIRGILMEEVIHYFYPYYGMIFVIHSMFVLLGQYGCTVKNRTVGAICIIGIIVCLVYETIIAYNIALSGRRAEQRVGKYIKIMAEQFSKEKISNKPTKLIYQIGKYISGCVIENNSHFTDTSSTNLIGRESQEKLDDCVELLNMVDLEKYKGLKGGEFVKNFKAIFANDENEEIREDYILYELPAFSDSITVFRQYIRLQADLWKSMLSEVQEESSGIRITCYVLFTAAKYKEQLLIPLSCGLILYLHETHIPATDVAKDQGWSKCAKFLYEMIQLIEIETTNGLEKDEETLMKLKMICRDITVTFVCLLYLDQVGIDRKINTQPLVNTLRLFQYEYRSTKADLFWTDSAIRKYLCFAYIIQGLLQMSSPNDFGYAGREKINKIVLYAVGCLVRGSLSSENMIKEPSRRIRYV